VSDRPAAGPPADPPDPVAGAVAARRPASLLDVGAGDGAWLAGAAAHLPPTTRLVGADLAAPADAPPARVRFVRGDAVAMPFADCGLSAVTARAVLHHVADPAAAVAELARLVAPGGMLLIRDATAMAPARAEELREYLVSRGHRAEPHAGVDPDELAQAARDAGLRVDLLDRSAGTAVLAGPRFATPAFQLVASRRRDGLASRRRDG
jgi:SAM-dependent methyltransferase